MGVDRVYWCIDGCRDNTAIQILDDLVFLNLLPKRHRRSYLRICRICLTVFINIRVWGIGFRGKLESWGDLIPLLHSILVHRPSGWLCVLFDSYVLILPMSKRESTIAIVSIDNFRQRLQSKLRQPIPVALHQSIGSFLDKKFNWSSDLAQWLGDSDRGVQRQKDRGRHDVVDDAGSAEQVASGVDQVNRSDAPVQWERCYPDHVPQESMCAQILVPVDHNNPQAAKFPLHVVKSRIKR